MNEIESIGMSEGSKMPHSLSTPAGVDGGSRTPPTTPRKAGKMLAIRVQMLDDTITMFQIQAKALGKVLFDQVCKQLHLLEADYFGLEYQEPNGTKFWLDLEKPICRQVGLSLIDPLLKFCVKFYTPDPAQLEEEFTRYLFCLQIKRDLAQGLLQCNDNTAALMASYIVQAECGDYVIEDYPDHTYLSTYKFVPHQDHELERRIMDNHKKHAGQSPAEADLNLLETARRCELYGMKMHPAKDHEGVPLNLAVAHMGIIVFQHYTKINTFSWAKIRKISFKRKRFLIKLHPEGYGYYKDTVEFFFEGRNECKNFWKKCVENHGFFRCTIVKRVVRQKTRVLSRGSSFRYSGKTQKQIVEFVRDNYVKRQTFHRSNSFRQTSSGRALQGLEGGGYRGATSSSSLMGSSSISAHPLLPLGDPALETPALSLSYGSMTLDSPTTVTNASGVGTSHRRDDTVTSFRTLTSIDVHSPATPSLVQAQQPSHATNQQRISSTGRISPSNSSSSEFPQPRPIPRHPWQRSASCRELYASSFEDSGKARPKEDKTSTASNTAFQLPSQGELDNPVTRYDENNRSYSAASSKLPSLDHDSVPDRVYSSSYPGTSSLSTESGHEESTPAGDLSHDDLSHDSYELLEREHECEYESYSSPRDENEPMSDNSDEGIEPEMFQMDSETDSFVKLKLSKDKSNKKSAFSERSMSKNDEEFIIQESRIHRTGTQIERKFEKKPVSAVVETQAVVLQDVSKKPDPVILQVQKQKMTMLNELKNLKPKHRISHVDSEVLRDEGIMRPKSRIDDDWSPSEPNKTILDKGSRERTTRARSIASLEEQELRQYVQTGSLGRNHKSRENSESKKSIEKEARRQHREEKKRENSRELRKTDRRSLEKYESRERSNSRDYYVTKFSERMIDLRELRRSIERLDSDKRDEYSDFRNDFTKQEKLGLRELRKSLENLDIGHRHSNRHYSQRSMEGLDFADSKANLKADWQHRHTLERFDLTRQYDKPISYRRKSIEQMFRVPASFDQSFEVSEPAHERKGSYKRSSRERKSLEKLDSIERKSFEYMDRYTESRRSIDRIDYKDPHSYLTRGRSEERPPERDDWRSLEKARKISERREREYQAKLSFDSRTDNLVSSADEKKNYKNETVFAEYIPKVVGGVVLGFEDIQSSSHTPVERAKSDPNSSRQRLGSNSKRHMLMHQKSIDLTPADSGDEDAFSDGIAVQKSNIDIPYTLHKRHVMNGTAADDKSESDGGKPATVAKTVAKDLTKKTLADVALDFSKIQLNKPATKLSTDKPKGILVSPDKPKSILSSTDKSKSILSPKLSPTDHKIFPDNSLSPSNRSPAKSPTVSPKSSSLDHNKPKVSDKPCGKSISLDKKSKICTAESITIITTDKKSLKRSPTDTAVMIVSAIEKKKSPDSSYKSPTSRSPASKSPTSRSPSSRSPSSRSPTVADKLAKGKGPLNFATVVGMEIKQELERREREKLAVPDDSLEKQDSIEKIPLPEIPVRIISSEGDGIHIEGKTSPKIVKSPVKSKEDKLKNLEKPSIPEKTKRILDKIESKFSEFNKTSTTKVPRPKVIDTGYDDFVDPVAELPLDDVPVKPALELDSLKVPEFNSFMFRPHTESFRSKSLSLAEEKAPIDTLLSPEVENKQFLDVSPKKTKKPKVETKKDFQKQSKSLEGDKPPLKKSGSKELRTSPSPKIDKSKLKLNEMPQEIIVIDSTDIVPEVSIIQKGRSKSITRISSERSFDETKSSKTKSASVDDETIKTFGSSEKLRPKTLGISKSLGSTEKKDSVEKVSPKKRVSAKVMTKTDSAKSTDSGRFDPPLPPVPPPKSKISKSPEPKVDTSMHEDVASAISERAERMRSEQIEKAADKKDAKKTGSGQESGEPSVVTRKAGHSPVLFARSRLGLSEGSGIGALQRQGATQSPTSQRRAKSLDAPIISLHRLPPANAFSSKDDTVDINEETELKDAVPNESTNVIESSYTQSIQQATSINVKSDSTEQANMPQIFTDSSSVTETSAQYLESPLTENNEIVICPDLIPYEQEVKLTTTSSNVVAREPKLSSIVKMFANAAFIDQNVGESNAEKEKSVIKDTKADTHQKVANIPDITSSSVVQEPELPEEPISTPQEFFTSVDDQSLDGSYVLVEKEDMPNVTVNVSESFRHSDIDFNQSDIDMVKSPIQISIEECSDNDVELSDSQEDPEDRTFHVEVDDKRDNSEDTLDSLDTQVQMQGIDSERSSPDYLGDKTDEKTLVEVELTPEYLEMKKEEEDAVENLPEDEPVTKVTTPDTLDTNRLNIDKKLRLSAERSRSDETNTWTPDRDDPDSSSCSIARPLGIGQIQTISDTQEIAQMKLVRSFGSAEEESSSSVGPRPELSSTWRPFPLESSGSSSLEEGWIPQDDSNQQIYSEDNNDNNDSFQEDLDFPSGIGFPVGPEILASYGAFSLSRTLSRISERSTTSEQDKSDLDDSFKPSSRSPSLDDESLISSDHQPSLSSDPPSGAAFPSVSEDRRTSSELPEIPIDVAGGTTDDGKSPKRRRSRLTLQSSEDWPSPPSSPIFDNTPIISHVETFYMDIRPEEAARVTVTDSTDTTTGRVDHDSDSDEENRTLHDDLHSTFLEEPSSASAATTVDGTVKIAVKPKSNSYITGSSHSEDTSMGLSMSEWSSSNNTVRQFCQYSGTKSDDNSLTDLGVSISDWSGSTTVIPQQYVPSTVTTQKSQSDPTSEKNSVCLRTLKSQTSIYLEEEDEEDEEILQIEKEELEPPTLTEEEPRDSSIPPTISELDEVGFVEDPVDDPDDEETLEFAETPPPPRLQEDEDEISERDFDMIPEIPDILEIPRPIPEEDEDQYDSVPAMRFTSGEQICIPPPGEDMQEKFASLTVRSRSGDDDWSFEDHTPSKSEEGSSTIRSDRPTRYFRDQRQGTRSTERPVMVPIRMKTTSYYSTTSLSGESTTSSPPMPIRTQIRTKTMPYSSNKSPQSEGDTSSSMDSPGHTPDRGQRAFRRKRQQRKHRVVVDLEVKDGHIVSSTDSSFDISTIPPPLLPEQSLDDVEGEDEEYEDMSESAAGKQNQGHHIESGKRAVQPTKQPERENNNLVLTNAKQGDSEESDVKKNKKWPTDKAYFIAKELLMTERTYKKDLDVINVWFRDEVSKESTIEGEAVVSLMELLADVHGPCLQEMESRVARWENNARHNIGDFLYNTLLNVLPLYDQYLENLIPTLEKVEYFTRTSKQFEQLCWDFEAQKHCYLPLTSFLLKPLQRLLHYNSIIETLLDHYPKDHTDFEDCLAARDRLGETLVESVNVMNQAQNLALLCELQRDINGFENLVQEGRRFIRQGCMQKFSKKGFQQRMFFLFSDVLLYTYRTQQPTQCFRVQGQMPIKGMRIDEESIYCCTGNEFTFGIRGQGNQSLLVATNSEEERERWLEDLSQTIEQIDSTDGKLPYLDLKSFLNSADDSTIGMGNDVDRTSCGGAKASQRTNTAVHVCWHRNTSISYSDLLRAFQNQLSGFLLRKFKNSNGWQKLWVVFTNFCLFFYKSHQDDFPLASLPLLGYTVSTPSEKDGINKDFVFKLQFKNHVYFFRAESDYTFGRWMEVIKSAT